MGITRRDFLRGAGTGAGLAAVVGAEAAPAEARELKTKGGREVPSLCYYCAVGCGIVASVADGKVVAIQGDPEHPINRGTLCSKAQAYIQVLDHPRRLAKVLYPAPGAADWQEKPLEGWALEVYNGKLYAGTRQEGGNGKVYVSVGSETPGTPPPTLGPVDYIPKGLGIPNAPFAGALPRRRRATTPTPASRGVPERLQRPPSPPLEGTRRG